MLNLTQKNLEHKIKISEDAKNTIIEAETIFKGSIEEKAISKSEVKLKIFKK